MHYLFCVFFVFYVFYLVPWEKWNYRLVSRELYVQYKSKHWTILWTQDNCRWSEWATVLFDSY